MNPPLRHFLSYYVCQLIGHRMSEWENGTTALGESMFVPVRKRYCDRCQWTQIELIK